MRARIGFVAAFLLASFVATGSAMAGRINGDGGGGGSFSGGTLLSQLIFSAISVDITTGTNEDLVLRPNGTGVVRHDGAVQVALTDGTVRGDFGPDTGSVAQWYLKSSAGSGGELKISSGNILAGRQTDAATSTRIFCAADGLSPTLDGTNQMCVLGEGLQEITQRQTISNATATLDTTTPTSSSISFNCTSGTVCNYEPGETSIRDGEWFDLMNVGSASIVVTDSAGKVKLRTSPTTLTVNQSMHCLYANTLWSCI